MGKEELAVKQDSKDDKGFVSIDRSVLNIDILNDKDKALELFKVLAKGKLAKDKSPEEPDSIVLYIIFCL